MATESIAKLLSEQGDRSIYDAVSQCSRCGYCEQACPTYVVTGKEHFSGRGRNQVMRMLLEKKFSDPQAADESLSTCLLCGACTSACYAHVPTADLVLEGRRMLRGERKPFLIRVLRWLLEDHPEILKWALKFGYALKRAGLADLAARTHILSFLGWDGLEVATLTVKEAPTTFLFETLGKDNELRDFDLAQWGYFAPCGPNYLLPRVGLATVRLLKENIGPGVFLGNPCCGLLFYNYGDLEAAKRLAKRNIENFETKLDRHSGAGRNPGIKGLDPALGNSIRGQLSPKNVVGGGFHRGDLADAPVVGDCSSCVAHLKSYPQLFIDDPEWRPRAERFAARVKDVIEIPLKPLSPMKVGEEVLTYHDSCRARHGQGLVHEPRCQMKEGIGGNYAELPEAGWCCGGAGAFAFTQPELSDEVLKRKIGHIATVQARTVATSSTSCLLQLAHGLRKYYPECRVSHVSELWVDKNT